MLKRLPICCHFRLQIYLPRADSLEKTLMLGKTEGRERRGWQRTMVGCHHRLNGYEFEQAPGDSEEQGGLLCCGPRSLKELDTTEQLNMFSMHTWPWHLTYEPNRISLQMEQDTLFLRTLWSRFHPGAGSQRQPQCPNHTEHSTLSCAILGAKICAIFFTKCRTKWQMALIPSLWNHIAQWTPFCYLVNEISTPPGEEWKRNIYLWLKRKKKCPFIITHWKVCTVSEMAPLALFL